jgi:hypothetical protein
MSSTSPTCRCPRTGGARRGFPSSTRWRALDAVLASPRLAGLTITELNPDHAERGAGAIERFAAAVAESLTGALRTHGITG